MSRLTANVCEIILLWFIDEPWRLFARLEVFYRSKQESAHLDDESVTGAEVFDTSIDDRPHAFGGASILIQELSDAGEVGLLLGGAVLQIVVALVAQFLVTGID